MVAHLNFGPAKPAEEDVAGLEVKIDDALCSQVFQALENLMCHGFTLSLQEFLHAGLGKTMSLACRVAA